MSVQKPRKLALLDRYVRWLHHECTIGPVEGVPVSVVEQSAVLRERSRELLTQALELVRHHDRRALHRIHHFVRGIMVISEGEALAKARSSVGIITVNEAFVLAPTTTPQAMASLLIHETTHLWLHGLGFDYREERRGRVERICFRAELRFAHRCVGGEALVSDLEACLEVPDTRWSTEALARDEFPGWLVSVIMWLRQRRRCVV